jgi:hypothetical protein
MATNRKADTMSNEEMRELDAWIAENVMGWAAHCRNTAFYVPKEQANKLMDCRPVCIEDWRPTTNPAAAMEVLRKCVDTRAVSVDRWRMTGIYIISTILDRKHTIEEAPTLELAICLFAKQLFAQSTSNK